MDQEICLHASRRRWATKKIKTKNNTLMEKLE